MSILYGDSISLCRLSSSITLFWSLIPKIVLRILAYLVISLDIVILFASLFYAFMGVFYMMSFKGSLVFNPFHFLLSFTLFYNGFTHPRIYLF
jgi:hypothetical protein